MPLSLDVRLSREIEPRFPNACVECGASNPADLFVIKQRRVTLFSLFAPILFWLPADFEARAPACVECREEMQGVARRRLVALIVFSMAAVFAILQYAADWFPEDKMMRRLMMIGVVLLLLIPYIGFILLRPPAFDITVWKHSVDYEFRDEDYAAEFAELNDATYE